MAGEATRYRLEVYEGFWAALEAAPAAQQERITELMAGHLITSPKTMRPPLLKQLAGPYRHLRQFECGRSRRLLYEVDDEHDVVRIVYLGEHPEWDRAGKLKF